MRKKTQGQAVEDFRGLIVYVRGVRYADACGNTLPYGFWIAGGGECQNYDF